MRGYPWGAILEKCEELSLRKRNAKATPSIVEEAGEAGVTNPDGEARFCAPGATGH